MKLIAVLNLAIALLICAPAAAAAGQQAEGFVQVEGDGRLYYETMGTGESVVLIHGNAGDRRHWDAQFQELSRYFSVIRYDVRGFGLSAPPGPGVTYSDQEDLLALLDHLQVGRAHVVGWSFGSGVAFDFATANPSRVRSVVAVGPWVNGYSSPRVDAFYETMAALGTELAEQAPQMRAATWMRSVLSNTIRDPAAGQEFARIAADYSWWAYLNGSQSRVLQPSANDRLGGITAPLLVMTAEYDLPVCQEMAEHIGETVPHARLTHMLRTGHLMHMEQPQEFNKILLAFLQSAAQR